MRKAKARGKPKRSKLERLKAERSGGSEHSGGEAASGDDSGDDSDDDEDAFADMDMSMMASDMSDDEESDAATQKARAALLSSIGDEPAPKKSKKGKKNKAADEEFDNGLGKGLRMDRHVAGDSDDEDDHTLYGRSRFCSQWAPCGGRGQVWYG